jgi:hypothetical protein
LPAAAIPGDIPAGPRPRLPPPRASGITTIIGTAFFSAIRLSMMIGARPVSVHPGSRSPPPCSKYRTGYRVVVAP